LQNKRRLLRTTVVTSTSPNRKIAGDQAEDQDQSGITSPAASTSFNRVEEIRCALQALLRFFRAAKFIETLKEKTQITIAEKNITSSTNNIRILIKLQRHARKARVAAKLVREERARRIVSRSVESYILKWAYRYRSKKADIIVNFLTLLSKQISFRIIIRKYLHRIVTGQRAIRRFLMCRNARKTGLFNKLENISNQTSSVSQGVLALQTYAEFIILDYLRRVYKDYSLELEDHCRAEKSNDFTPSFRDVTTWEAKSFLLAPSDSVMSDLIPQFVLRKVGSAPTFKLFSRPFIREELLSLVELARRIAPPITKKARIVRKIVKKKKEDEVPPPQFNKEDDLEVSIKLFREVTMYLNKRKR